MSEDNYVRKPVPGDLYWHFKGHLYQIVAIATHSETREEMVIYQALYGSYGVYARPYGMFVSLVDREKYPNTKQKFRFEHVSKEEAARLLRQNSADGRPEAMKAVQPTRKSAGDMGAVQPIGRSAGDMEAVRPIGRSAGDMEAIQSIGRSAGDMEAVQPIGQRPDDMEVHEYREGVDINPDLLMFLDADTAEEKIKILREINERIDERTLNSMEVSMDIVGVEGNLDERIAFLMNALSAKSRYENNRLR